MVQVTDNAVKHLQQVLDEQIAHRKYAKELWSTNGCEMSESQYYKFDERVEMIIRTATILGIELETK